MLIFSYQTGKYASSFFFFHEMVLEIKKPNTKRCSPHFIDRVYHFERNSENLLNRNYIVLYMKDKDVTSISCKWSGDNINKNWYTQGEPTDSQDTTAILRSTFTHQDDYTTTPSRTSARPHDRPTWLKDFHL